MLERRKDKLKPGSTEVVIAALNEEQGIGLTISELKVHLGRSRIIVVDGRSIDRTIEVAKDLGAEVFFQDGIGKGDALVQGIKATTSSAEYIVITDADFTYPAEYLPSMVQVLEEDPRVGMVCGNRFNGNVDAEALHSVFAFGNKLIALAHNLFNGIKLADPLTGLRVIRADLLRNWRPQSKGFDIEVELNHYVERSGYATVEIPIHYRQRLGEKKLKVSDGAAILKRIIFELK